jgi:hypothetical protein
MIPADALKVSPEFRGPRPPKLSNVVAAALSPSSGVPGSEQLSEEELESSNVEFSRRPVVRCGRALEQLTPDFGTVVPAGSQESIPVACQALEFREGQRLDGLRHGGHHSQTQWSIAIDAQAVPSR